ncbi:MAG: sigma-70 family RNA polymerase sigma factor [Gemmataceae bacterium]|nr:sigma-70 family RNA polymerase sigma factor [Gemmataceae bacterium]MCI0741970.1 sigma-70 family RNA polymerase sigma factor [Gemmataceae bacterium]
MPDTSLSLLEQLRSGADPSSWERLVTIYTPLLQVWLRRFQVLPAADVDDLTQEVLLAVSKDVARFEPSSASGGFRAWLRGILVNRVRYFWRARQHRPAAIGGSDFLNKLDQLSDHASQVSQHWDKEHDLQVMRRLLELVQPRFAGATWQAFQRQAVDGRSAEEVAAELGMPLHSVYASKSRVLKALRTLAEGLL